MDDITYTDRMQGRSFSATEIFLELLADHKEFRTEAERIGREYRDLLETRWRTLEVNLRRDQRWSDYCAAVTDLCHRFGIYSATWAPKAVHHVIARIVINQPTHHYITFYYDPLPSNKRARVPETLRQQVELAFMRIVRGMSPLEIWAEFPDEGFDTINQRISRGAKELGIKLK